VSCICFVFCAESTGFVPSTILLEYMQVFEYCQTRTSCQYPVSKGHLVALQYMAPLSHVCTSITNLVFRLRFSTHGRLLLPCVLYSGHSENEVLSKGYGLYCFRSYASITPLCSSLPLCMHAIPSHGNEEGKQLYRLLKYPIFLNVV